MLRLRDYSEAFDQRTARIQRTVEAASVEQVVVLETIGEVSGFLNAARNAGLEWLLEIDEEATDPDDDFWDRAERTERLDTRAYLILSDRRAIQQLLEQWRAYSVHGRAGFKRGLTPWFHLFSQLKDVRLWDYRDQIEADTRTYWRERIDFGDEIIRTEIECWYSDSEQRNVAAAATLRELLDEIDAVIVDELDIPEIRYRGVLVDLPAAEADAILNGRRTNLSAVGSVMYFRPQLRATALPVLRETQEREQERPIPNEDPIVAVLDGVPLQNHRLLRDRLLIDDPRDLAAQALAHHRIHGTSMASLVLHGDLGAGSATISSKVAVHPILIPDPGAAIDPPPEISEPNRLLLDTVHIAVRRLLEGNAQDRPIAPTVRVLNLSIADLGREFLRTVSPLARLLDWLSWKYRVLVLVPTGNQTDVNLGLKLRVPRQAFAGLSKEERAAASLAAVTEPSFARRLRCPAESLNALTVGGTYDDGSTFREVVGRFELYRKGWPDPYSRFGPGFLRAVKPDVVAPAGRRLFQERLGNVHREAVLVPLWATGVPPGVESATPGPNPEALRHTKFTSGTSNSCAIVAHYAAHAHKAVEQARANSNETRVPPNLEAVAIKALIVHGAAWPESDELTSALNLNNLDARSQKAALSRIFGYGVVDVARVEGGAARRATVMAVGEISPDRAMNYKIPLPNSLSGKREYRRLTVTLAWLSPINCKHRKYRRALLWFSPPRAPLQVQADGADWQAARRGTVQHAICSGERAAVFADDEVVEIDVNCAADAGDLAEPVPYALCVSIEVAEGSAVPVFQEIANKLGIRTRVRVAPR